MADSGIDTTVKATVCSDELEFVNMASMLVGMGVLMPSSDSGVYVVTCRDGYR